MEDELGQIVSPDAKYAGFNLLLLAPTLGSAETVQYDSLLVTNHGGGGTLTSRGLQPGERACGGISNGIDNAGANEWPKLLHATKDLDTVLQTLTPGATESELTEHLFKLLLWVLSCFLYPYILHSRTPFLHRDFVSALRFRCSFIFVSHPLSGATCQTFPFCTFFSYCCFFLDILRTLCISPNKMAPSTAHHRAQRPSKHSPGPSRAHRPGWACG